MWGLDNSLTLIRKVQPEIHKLGYHACLAGSVLNKGMSDKDLDLVFVPLTNKEKPELGGLCIWFDNNWGTAQDNITDPEPCLALRYQASYILPGGLRIDVFVV